MNKRSCYLFVFCLLIGGLWCIFHPQEIWFDLYNYHYYNAWAFLNNKTFLNIAPASVHSYFNPLPDLWLYTLIHFFNSTPGLIFYCQGLWVGLLWFLCLKILGLVIPLNTKTNKVIYCSLSVFCLCGFAVIRQMGTCTNEIQLACLFLIGTFLIIKNIQNSSQNKKQLVLACFLIGMTLGLKWTIFPPAVAMGITVLIFYKKLTKHPVDLCYFLASALGGFLFTNGWWMYQLYQHTGNPFFPYFNNLFHSFLLQNGTTVTDMAFAPNVWWHGFIVPFQGLWHKNLYFTDIFIRHFQFPIIYAAAIIHTILWIIKRNRQVIHRFILCFWWCNYFIWVYCSSVLRYGIILEIMGGILVALLIIKIPYKTIKWLLTILLLTLALYLPKKWYTIWRPRKDNISHYLYKYNVQIADDTVLITLGPVVSWIIPSVQTIHPVIGDYKSVTNTQFDTTKIYDDLFVKRKLKVAFLMVNLEKSNYELPKNITCQYFQTPWTNRTYICPPIKDNVITGYDAAEILNLKTEN